MTFAHARSSASVAVTLSLLLAAAAMAQTPAAPITVPQILDGLGKTHWIAQTAISPDAQHLAWVLSAPGGSEILLAGPHGEDPRKIATPGKGCSSSGIAFSPDSHRLAFLSDCGSEQGEAKPGEGKVTQDEIFLASVEEPKAKAKQLSHLHGYAHDLAWSPDGRQIGLLYVEGATRPAGALDAMKPPAGVIGVEGLEVQRVAAVDSGSGQLSQITPEGLHVYEFDWSPDSQQLAYVAAPPPGENNWWVAKLYTQKVGSAPKTILDPVTVEGPLHGLQIAVPRWSPEGTKIAFIGGLISDQGATGGDLYMMHADGSTLTVYPGNGSIAWFHWKSHDSIQDQIIESGIVNGNIEISQSSIHFPPHGVPPPNEAPRNAGQGQGLGSRAFSDPYDLTNTLIVLPANIGDGRLELSLSIAKDGTTAFVSSSFDHAPEVYTAKLESGANPQPATHYNDALKPSWGKAESVTWKSDNFDVQGWLLFPANYDPTKKYPLITYVHGGPSSAELPHWPGVGYGPIPFSAMGYFVLMPNPRGSYGEGEAFTQANRRDFGYGDLRDILAGVDAVEAKYPIDDKRLGLTGWSYGGFMTMFAVTQTNRFHAAVAGAGIANWQSYYGQNSIDQWMTPFFGATVYDDPAIYAKSSAIDYIKQAKTPTLVVVGDRDGECPAPQSFEFWHALKAEGVPTELVVYPNEGHAFRQPGHRRDVLERALTWFQKYM